MLLRIKNNAKYIFTRFTIIASMIFGLISIMQMFVDWDVLGVKGNDTKCKIIIFCLILVGCIVIALIWGIFFSNSRSVLVEDEVHIVVKYGDLLKIAFPKKYSGEKIVVIAVNRCFDVSAKYSCGFPDPQVLPIIVVDRYLDYFTTIMEDRLWQVLAKPGFRWRNRSGLSMNAARAA